MFTRPKLQSLLSMHLFVFSHLGHEHFGILGLGDTEELLLVTDLDGQRHPPQRLLVLLLLVVDLTLGSAAALLVVGDARHGPEVFRAADRVTPPHPLQLPRVLVSFFQ